MLPGKFGRVAAEKVACASYAVLPAHAVAFATIGRKLPKLADRARSKHSDGTYTISQPDQTQWSFDASGRLGAIVDRH
jgi:hypothetical protein